MSQVTKKGQVTIPKPMRDSLELKTGDSVVFSLRDRELVLRKKERRSILSLGGIVEGRKKAATRQGGERT